MIREALLRLGPTRTIMDRPKRPRRIKGRVVSYRADRGYGFVAGDDRKSYFLDRKIVDKCCDFDPQRDDPVSFVPAPPPRGRKCQVATELRFED